MTCRTCTKADIHGGHLDESISHCRQCHRTWPRESNQAHCAKCHLHFTTPSAFDRHIHRGEHVDPATRGLVLTDDTWGYPSPESTKFRKSA